MNYYERLLRYEAEKKFLQTLLLTAEEYEQAIKALADKWRI
jgi:hypothetical protein